MRDPAPPNEILSVLARSDDLDFEVLSDEEALPDRIVDRLIDIVLIADELRSLLHVEEASPILWLEAHLDRLLAETDAALLRIAN